MSLWMGALIADVLDDLVAQWKFDDGSGDYAIDSIADFDGTLSGTTKPTWGSGHINGGLNFNGTTAYVNVPVSDGDALDLTGPLTVAAWMRPETHTAAYSYIVSKNLNAGYVDQQYALTMEPNGLVGTVGGVRVPTSTPGPYTWVDGTWYHVVVTWDGTYVLLYVNGSAIITPTGISPSFVYKSSFSIGRRNDLYYFDGDIDDVRIYNRALSEPEIDILAAM